MVLTGRVAAITGASSGIGLACAKHLAAAGAAVVLGARRTSLLESTAAQIRATGGRAAIASIDVVREEDVQALTAMATREFGRLDIMICNAGFGYYGTIEDTPPDVMQRMMNVNYMGTYYGARAALPLFRAQNAGHLIFVSSIVGRRGIAFMGGYAATKAAQAGLAESLRTEFHEAMTRDYGHTVRGLGPKQSVDDVARAIVRCIQRPRPEVYPHAMSRALAVINQVAPAWTDRFVQKFGRRRDAV